MDTTANLPDEQELGEALQDDPEFFMRSLWEYYHKPLIACIGKNSFDMLTAEELADCLQDVMLAVWETVRKPDFDPYRPLRMVFRIARNKAIDYRRRKMGRKDTVSIHGLAEILINDLNSTWISIALKVMSEEEKARFDAALPRMVEKLPNQQRVAFRAFCECLEEIRAKNKYGPVAEAMSRLTGKKGSIRESCGLDRVECLLLGGSNAGQGALRSDSRAEVSVVRGAGGTQC